MEDTKRHVQASQVLHPEDSARTRPNLRQKESETFLAALYFFLKRRGKETVYRNAYRKQMDQAKRRTELVRPDVFSLSELQYVISNLCSRKTGGPDDVQIHFLKELSAKAKDALLLIFNRFYDVGSTLSSWRVAEMIPIEEPGKQYEFRPISLTNFIARCMEKLVLLSFQPWAESVLSEEPTGFRKYRSCEEQIAGLTEDMAQEIYGRQVRTALLQ